LPPLILPFNLSPANPCCSGRPKFYTQAFRTSYLNHAFFVCSRYSPLFIHGSFFHILSQQVLMSLAAGLGAAAISISLPSFYVHTALTDSMECALSLEDGPPPFVPIFSELI